ncbi:MAG: hypothetical protein AB7R67_18915 [Vicinamibacterales bacterium]
MADLTKGEIPFEANGVSYTLALNIGAIMAAERQASSPGDVVTWNDLVDRIQASHVTSIVCVFWALFQKHHPDITLARAGELVQSSGGLKGLAEMLATAMDATSPDPKDVAELASAGGAARPRKARAGTGGSTTTSPAASA